MVDSHASDPQTNAIHEPFDAQRFLSGLDAIFAAHDGGTKAEPYLRKALDATRAIGDKAGELTVLNELMGFYRSQSRHGENLPLCDRAVELARDIAGERSEAYATTLINAATGYRAAGKPERALDLYRQALSTSEATMPAGDRRLAALHNNLSILHSDMGDPAGAKAELERALAILTSSSVDPAADIDIATTNTNLSLVCFALGERDEAAARAQAAMDIYEHGNLKNSAHYASAVAGSAQACYEMGEYARAVALYRKALAIIEDCYGTDNDYHRVTEENLAQAIATAKAAGIAVDDADAADATGETSGDGKRSFGSAALRSGRQEEGNALRSGRQGQKEDAPRAARQESESAPAEHGEGDDASDGARRQRTAGNGNRPAISGLELARRYWTEVGKPMVEAKYPDYAGRIAAGLVGHGSECYGFDDEISQDHDFGPRFCLWLTDEDYAAIGEALQADYEALPGEFMGFGAKQDGPVTPRAQGAGRRDGVFRIGDFFESITGYRQAPAADQSHEWLLLEEATLAAATNGDAFADPLGEFSRTRQGFKNMPDQVRLALISRRLGMIAQAGQYNLPRMLERGDGAAAMLSIGQFTDAVSSLVFLINEPITAGYAPYYKWRFAGLRRLSSRIWARLGDECARLEEILRLASAACYGGAGFGEGGKGSAPAVARINELVETICAGIVNELKRDGLTRSDETFLEWQRPYVEEHIDDPWLRSL